MMRRLNSTLLKNIMLALMAFPVLGGCGRLARTDWTVVETQLPVHHVLELHYETSRSHLSKHQNWIRFSVVPLQKTRTPGGCGPDSTNSGPTDLVPTDSVLDGERVKPRPTPWAKADDHQAIISRMDHILRANGVYEENERVRMIAHAIVASGWKQKVWNHNAWGVKRGSWDGAYYHMPTVEVRPDGRQVAVADEQWRAFDSWGAAIADFRQRISAQSERPAYREAYRYLTSEQTDFATSVNYWEALGSGNYYTATKFTGEKFAMLCTTVRQVIRSSSSGNPA